MIRALCLTLLAALAVAVPASAHVDPPLPRLSFDASLNSALSVSQALAAAPAGVNETWCPGDPGRTTDDTQNAVSNLPRVKVIYAYASDQPNNFSQYADQLQKSVKGMMGVVAHHSGGRKSLRFDMGTGCGPGYADIQTVRLPETLAHYTSVDGLSRQFELAPLLRDMGFARPNHYVVFFDNAFTGDSVGVNYISGDPTPGPSNDSNLGGSIALTWGYGQTSFFGDATGEYALIHVPLHEIFHGLGAVNFYAPHASSPTGHCTDEYDVLCGQSGGAKPLDTGACPTGQTNLVLDCNKDDYFDPTGTITGTNGQTIWNTYDSVFLCAVARCGNAPPTAAIATSGGRAGEPIGFSAAGSTDDEALARYEWDLDGDGSYETDTGASASALRTFDAAGDRTAGVRVTDSDGIARTSSTGFTVAPGAPGGSGASGGAGGLGGAGDDGVTPARLGSLSLSPARFRVPRKSSARAARIRYALDQAAAMTFTVEHARPGRRSGKKCAAPSSRNRRARKCTRYVAVRGKLTHAGQAGTNTRTWNGRLGRRALGVGSYRLLATPAGGDPRRASFKVKR